MLKGKPIWKTKFYVKGAWAWQGGLTGGSNSISLTCILMWWEWVDIEIQSIALAVLLLDAWPDLEEFLLS